MDEQFVCSPIPTSLKYKLKHKLLCGCFKNHPNNYDQLPNEPSPTSHHHRHHHHHSLTRTSSMGGSGGSMESTIRSCKSEEFNLKDKCRSLISRMGSTSTPRSGQQHRKSRSTDFRYDPNSYALNFEDDNADIDDHFPFRNFSARLPTSPRAAPIRSVSDGVFNHTAPPSDQPTPSTCANAPPPREITAYT